MFVLSTQSLRMIPPGIGPGYPRCKRGVLPLDYGINKT